MADDYEIPYIKDIMKIRMRIKADKSFAADMYEAIEGVARKHGLEVSPDAIRATIIVHPEEVATNKTVGDLPVGSQCQAW